MAGQGRLKLFSYMPLCWRHRQQQRWIPHSPPTAGISGTIDPAVLTTFLRLRPIWQQALAEELNGAILVTPTVAHTAPRLAPLQADAEGICLRQ